MRRHFKYKPMSSDVLHWSQDNQIAFCTHDAVHIIAPSDKMSSTQVLSQKFRPRRFCLDNDYNNLDHIRSSQLQNNSFVQICWSPTGLSVMGGCMLLSISSHHYVEVYAPVDDPKSGSWTRVLDLTTTIEELSSHDEKRLEQLQSTCISWSSMIRNSCIASVGDKSGRILFFLISQNRVDETLSLQVCDSWISKCAWADWKQEGSDYFTYYSTAAIDGSVKVWKIIYSNGKLEAIHYHDICNADRLLVTALSFDKDSNFLKLAFCKGYSVFTWSMKSEEKLSSVRLPCYMNICSIIWSRFDSCMRVYSSDGMCFVLSLDKSGSLIILDDESNRFRNSVMKNESITIDLEEELNEEENEQPDQVIVYGAVSSFNSLFDCILFTSFKIHDVNYRTLTEETCSILIRPILDSSDELILEDVASCFERPIKVCNSFYILWDIYEFYKTVDSAILLDIQNHFYSKSREIVSENMEDMIQTPSFKAHKLACYLSCLRTGQVDYILHTESVIYYIKYLLLTLKKLDYFSPSDLETISLINSLYLLKSNEWTELLTDLIKFYTSLYQNNQTKTKAEDLLLSLKVGNHSIMHKEECIVCSSNIPTACMTNGTCFNGHEWNRCSFCFKCIQSFSYRECMGCNAKACNSDQINLDLCMICGSKFRLVGVGFI